MDVFHSDMYQDLSKFNWHLLSFKSIWQNHYVINSDTNDLNCFWLQTCYATLCCRLLLDSTWITLLISPLFIGWMFGMSRLETITALVLVVFIQCDYFYSGNTSDFMMIKMKRAYWDLFHEYLILSRR